MAARLYLIFDLAGNVLVEYEAYSVPKVHDTVTIGDTDYIVNSGPYNWEFETGSDGADTAIVTVYLRKA